MFHASIESYCTNPWAVCQESADHRAPPRPPSGNDFIRKPPAHSQGYTHAHPRPGMVLYLWPRHYSGFLQFPYPLEELPAGAPMGCMHLSPHPRFFRCPQLVQNLHKLIPRTNHRFHKCFVCCFPALSVKAASSFFRIFFSTEQPGRALLALIKNMKYLSFTLNTDYAIMVLPFKSRFQDRLNRYAGLFQKMPRHSRNRNKKKEGVKIS